MYVPPYVPQPIEISGNVAQESYLVRLGFVRRVALAHFLTVIIAACLSTLPMTPAVEPLLAGLSVFVVLIVLSLVRGVAKGRAADQRMSIAVLPILLVALAIWIRALSDRGWAVWALGVGAAAALAYIFLCGRDLSFVGMFVIPAVVSSIIVVAAAWQLETATWALLAGLALNAIYLFYFVYDLAALLTRRRLGEEWGAVADLYRDVLNLFTYPIRVYHHWRDHRIWIPPKEWFR